MTSMIPGRRTVEDLYLQCRYDPDRFNTVFLGRPKYWWRQSEICQSVMKYPETWVPAGHAVGKGYVCAGILLHFLTYNPGCLVVSTAPSQTQLEEVLWKEVERAYVSMRGRIPLGARFLRNPLKLDLGGGWQALGYSTTKTERISGHHAPELLGIIDEASGVVPEIWEAFDSLNCSRKLVTGNPIRPDGVFYERCRQAQEGDAIKNLIRIPATESPDIGLPRSPRALADATWLAQSRQDYGEGSLWWISHVDAQFPDSAADHVFQPRWLDRCADAPHHMAGIRRIAIDLAEGNDGDRSVVLCRDDNGVLDLEFSTTWNFERTAFVASIMRQKWGVEPGRITYDAAGIGADFANRMDQFGMRAARPARGSNAGGPKFGNLRTAACWALRQRLDPEFREAGVRSLPPFSIRGDWLKLLRPELQGLQYHLGDDGRLWLESKDDYRDRLKHSPDFADALIQSFAYRN